MKKPVKYLAQEDNFESSVKQMNQSMFNICMKNLNTVHHCIGRIFYKTKTSGSLKNAVMCDGHENSLDGTNFGKWYFINTSLLRRKSTI